MSVVTVTEFVSLMLPPVPVQVIVYEVVTVGVTWSVPVVKFPVEKPVPVPVQLEALVEVQDNVAEAPVVIEVGVAVRVTVGGGVVVVTVSVFESLMLPPVPVQVIE